MKLNQISAAIFSLSFLPCAVQAAQDDDAFTTSFPLADCSFESRNGNTYFPLTPGRSLFYSNQACVDDGECDELEELTITTLNETRNITFTTEDDVEITVRVRVLQEYETADGELAEVSINFFAACNGDVYYFGEEVWIPEINGDPLSNPDGGASGPGAWLAGENGALPGIIFPGGAFLLGARYLQELAEADGALDRAEHTAMNLEVEVEAGEFEGCVEVTETTELDKKEETIKLYCPGVGLTVDSDLELEDIDD